MNNQIVNQDPQLSPKEAGEAQALEYLREITGQSEPATVGVRSDVIQKLNNQIKLTLTNIEVNEQFARSLARWMGTAIAHDIWGVQKGDRIKWKDGKETHTGIIRAVETQPGALGVNENDVCVWVARIKEDGTYAPPINLSEKIRNGNFKKTI